jgi:peptide/nickel transport system permease protein
MARWILTRTTEAFATALAAIVLLIVMIHYLPGDPLTAILQERAATPEQIAHLRRIWGADLSLPAVIVNHGKDLLHGSLGHSQSLDQPVTTVLAQRLVPTMLLGALTLLIDFTLGLALGVWSALRPETVRARLIGVLAIAGYAIPSFAIGMVLIWIFSPLQWLPAGGMRSLTLPLDATATTRFLDLLRHLILPVATMVIATIAIPLRQQRSAALATAAQPWVLAARARGVAPFRIAWMHCWRPALTPIITLLGLWLPMLVSGAVIVENVFAWPGIGTLIADATLQRDLPLVFGAGVLLIVLVQLGSMLADIILRILNPAQAQQS